LKSIQQPHPSQSKNKEGEQTITSEERTKEIKNRINKKNEKYQNKKGLNRIQLANRETKGN